MKISFFAPPKEYARVSEKILAEYIDTVKWVYYSISRINWEVIEMHANDSGLHYWTDDERKDIRDRIHSHIISLKERGMQEPAGVCLVGGVIFWEAESVDTVLNDIRKLQYLASMTMEAEDFLLDERRAFFEPFMD